MRIASFLFFTMLTTGLTYAQKWENYTYSLDWINCITFQDDTVWIGSQGGVAKFLRDGTKLATYTHADGLAANNVNSIAIDKDGNKWFGTGNIEHGSTVRDGGVSKFDGVKWTTYNTYNSDLPGNRVTAITIDAFNNKWIAGNGGLSKFDGTTWTNFNMNIVGSPLFDSQSNLWVYSGGLLQKFDGTNWTTFQPVNNTGTNIGPIGSIAIDHNDVIWLGAYGIYPPTAGRPGLYRFDGTSWTVFHQFNSGFCSASNIIVDKHNNKWFDNYCKFDDTNWTTNTIPCGMAIQSLLSVDSNDIFWFKVSRTSSTIDSVMGVYKYDGNTCLRFNPSNSGVDGDFISAIVVDHQDNAFITAGNLLKFDGSNWTTINSYASGYSGSLALAPTGNIWLGSSEFDGANWTQRNYNTVDGYGCVWIWTYGNTAFEGENVVWFIGGWQGYGGVSGLVKYDFLASYPVCGRWTVYAPSNSGIASENLSAIMVDSTGNKWVATEIGIQKFDGTNWVTYDTSNSGIASNQVHFITADKQRNMWFCTYDKGVSKFDGTNWTTFNTTNSGIGADFIREVAFDSTGNIWFVNGIASNGGAVGVTKYDGTNWATYNTFNSGLGCNEVTSIFIDAHNNKWFGTFTGGVSVLRDIDNTADVWVQYNENICDTNTITLNPHINFGQAPYSFSWQAFGDTLNCYSCENPVATITENSTFVVTVTDSNNISKSDTIKVFACFFTDIKEPSLPAYTSFKVYPNPANNTVNIELDSRLSTDADIVVWNFGGQQVIKTNSKGQSKIPLDVSQLDNGIYVISCRTKEQVGYRKLVIQR